MNDIKAPYGPLAFFLDLHPDLGDFREDALKALSKKPRMISPKYFYDERGSKLFQRITELPEYYPTRTEKSVFINNAEDIFNLTGPNASIFEYGSGASEKIEWLIKGLDNPVAYVAMDISKDHLLESAGALADIYDLPIAAICADFHSPVQLPEDCLPRAARWLGFFPGSTIGNMAPEFAARFLRRASSTLGRDARFLLGADLAKDPKTLTAAYNDAAGVTAEFNKNILVRMRRELDADLEIENFEHHAFYDEKKQRIEMHLRARKPTIIKIDGNTFQFEAGDTLHTENSYKYSIEGLKRLFEQTPWRLEKYWTDENGWFAACLLRNS